ncbi:10401_t:CDS:2, partial [Acaulospora colombiana]
MPLSSDKLTPAEGEENCPQCLHASHQTFTMTNKTVVDTSQCTDRCIVVACEPVEGDSTKTGGACTEEGCDALCQSFFGDPSTWTCDQEDCTPHYPSNWTWVETFPSIANHDKNVEHHPYHPYPVQAGALPVCGETATRPFLIELHWSNISNTTTFPTCNHYIQVATSPPITQHEVIQHTSEPDIDLLLAHLFTNHVPQPEEETPTPVLSHTTSHTSSNDLNDTSSIITSPITPTSGEAPNGTHHACNWADCSQTFTTVDELTDHIAEVHVGHGKSFYDCLWQGCDRHGDNGFPSRQKVLRHIQ